MMKLIRLTCILYFIAFSAQAAVDPVSIAFDGFESGNLSGGSGAWAGQTSCTQTMDRHRNRRRYAPG
jgi:hypothetical protein